MSDLNKKSGKKTGKKKIKKETYSPLVIPKTRTSDLVSRPELEKEPTGTYLEYLNKIREAEKTKDEETKKAKEDLRKSRRTTAQADIASGIIKNLAKIGGGMSGALVDEKTLPSIDMSGYQRRAKEDYEDAVDAAREKQRSSAHSSMLDRVTADQDAETIREANREKKRQYQKEKEETRDRLAREKETIKSDIRDEKDAAKFAEKMLNKYKKQQDKTESIFDKKIKKVDDAEGVIEVIEEGALDSLSITESQKKGLLEVIKEKADTWSNNDREEKEKASALVKQFLQNVTNKRREKVTESLDIIRRDIGTLKQEEVEEEVPEEKELTEQPKSGTIEYINKQGKKAVLPYNSLEEKKFRLDQLKKAKYKITKE